MEGQPVVITRKTMSLKRLSVRGSSFLACQNNDLVNQSTEHNLLEVLPRRQSAIGGSITGRERQPLKSCL